MPGWSSFVGFLEFILSTLTSWTGSLGIAIILFTILTRLAMLPLTIKQLKSSKKMQEIQPLMAELRRKYGKDQQKMTQEMTKLYREYNVNPAGSCLPILIQLPIFLGVYQAVYNLVDKGGTEIFLGIQLGLAAFQQPNAFTATLPNFQEGFQGIQYLILPVLSVVLQLLVTLMAQPKIQDPQQKAMMQAMMFMPLIFGYIGFTFNQGAVLYWVAGSVLAVIQQYFVSGFGSLTNYLPFLPERQGFLTPTTPAVVSTSGAETVEAESEAPRADFWAPLSKLTANTATSGDGATEQVISDVKRQINKKRR
ncbi:MAG TPA: YidC/Oxa1 family membrane protein insertase [Herpetosiphonaceae bacterium]